MCVYPGYPWKFTSATTSQEPRIASREGGRTHKQSAREMLYPGCISNRCNEAAAQEEPQAGLAANRRLETALEWVQVSLPDSVLFHVRSPGQPLSATCWTGFGKRPS